MPVLPTVARAHVPAGVNMHNPWMEAHKTGEYQRFAFGRPRAAYSRVDGTPAFNVKLDPAECEHGQFLDINVGRTVRCLDCGAEVAITPEPDPDNPGQLLGPWHVIPGTAPVDDEELQTLRDRHDAIWFSGDGMAPREV